MKDFAQSEQAFPGFVGREKSGRRHEDQLIWPRISLLCWPGNCGDALLSRRCTPGVQFRELSRGCVAS